MFTMLTTRLLSVTPVELLPPSWRSLPRPLRRIAPVVRSDIAMVHPILVGDMVKDDLRISKADIRVYVACSLTYDAMDVNNLDTSYATFLSAVNIWIDFITLSASVKPLP